MRPLTRLFKSGATRLLELSPLDRRRIKGSFATLQVSAYCVVLSFGVGCKKKPTPERPPETITEVRLEPAPKLKSFSWTPRIVEGGLCEDEIKRALALPKSEGTKTLDENRTMILVKAKAEPVLFVAPPEADPSVSKIARQIRHLLTTDPYPTNHIATLLPSFKIRPELGRSVLLRDGYLYAETADLAYGLVQFINAHHLFDAPRIWIQRGEQLLHAERSPNGEYFYVSGSQAGKRVTLIVFDRIGTGEPGPAIHRDVRSLRYRLHYDRFVHVHVTRDKIVADLHYGPLKIRTLLQSKGPRLELDCEIVRRESLEQLELHREREARKLRVVQALRDVMRQQIDEQLPFDEPLTEYGQQDGKLRIAWQNAYNVGKTKFDFQGDTYYVFDQEGRPRVPQVCVDFLNDTFERTSGTWWRPRGQKPERVIGRLNIDTLVNEHMRRVPDFLAFAEGHPEWFDVYNTSTKEQIQFRRRQEFYGYLQQNTQRYTNGDIIAIRGYTPFEKPWQTRVMHYHSFFIYETDPFTGMPIAIVGNAGRPSIRVWETEVRRTPKRSIWHRVRPHLYWLESIVDPKLELSTEPASLSIGPN